MASWLGTWAKRRKITIDQTQFDADLAWFPLPVKISSSTGKTGEDLGAVFADLGANRKRVAVTKTDGTTQLYVEIEKWDNAGGVALLWVSKSDWTISGSVDTDIYLYWDNAQADNTSFVGDVGARTEVWDSNFAVVHHLASLEESTSNNLDATLSDAPAQIAGIMGGGAYDFDGVDDLFVIPDSSVYATPRSTLTVELWVQEDATTQYRLFMAKGGWGSNPMQYYNNNPAISGLIAQSGGTFNNVTVGGTLGWLSTLDSTWHYLMMAAQPSGNGFGYGYADGVLVSTDNYANGQTAINNGEAINLGGGKTSNFNNCKLDEFRISLNRRSDAYCKAVYQSGKDNTNTFSATEALATGGPVALAGSTAGVSGSTGSLGVGRALAGAAAGSATLASAIQAARSLAGAAAGSSTLMGTARAAISLAGTCGGSSTVAGSAGIVRSLAGNSSGASQAAGSLLGGQGLLGATGGTSSAAGALGVLRGLSGSAAGTTAAAGVLGTMVPLAGATAGRSTVAGAVGAGTDLIGIISSVSSVAGAIHTAASLAGTAAGRSSTPSIVLAVLRALSGRSDGRASLVASLEALADTGIVGRVELDVDFDRRLALVGAWSTAAVADNDGKSVATVAPQTAATVDNNGRSSVVI